jgi:hypothetical protein
LKRIANFWKKKYFKTIRFLYMVKVGHFFFKSYIYKRIFQSFHILLMASLA